VVGGEQARREGPESQEPPTDGEGYDVAGLDLTGVQEDLIKAVAAIRSSSIVVVVNRSPLSVRWEAEHIPAIVEAWEPG
jgi:beta-glucosidase